MLKAWHEFYNVIGCVVNTNICQGLDADFEEIEVEKVLLHLPNGKSLGWDGINNWQRFGSVREGQNRTV